MNLGNLISRTRAISGSISTSRWTQQQLADFANDAQIQAALELDFPEATMFGATNPPPSTPPTLAIVGAPGAQSITYSYVNIAAPPWGNGDSIPSPPTQILDAPNTLDSDNNVTVTFPTVTGQRYKVLRQRTIDPFPTLLSTVAATSASTTFTDDGSFTPSFYSPQRGNEYQLNELVKVLRVYMVDQIGNVQPLVPNDIDILEGVTIEEWDQSSGQVAGAPQFTPKAIAQGAVTYPVASPFGRAPVKTPFQFTTGGAQRPQFYLRGSGGGYLGLLPPPIALYQIRVDYIAKPKTMTQNGDISDFPEYCRDLICYKMLSDIFAGEDNSREDNYLTKFYGEAARIREKQRSTNANKANGIVPIPIRTQMREWGC